VKERSEVNIGQHAMYVIYIVQGRGTTKSTGDRAKGYISPGKGAGADNTAKERGTTE